MLVRQDWRFPRHSMLCTDAHDMYLVSAACSADLASSISYQGNDGDDEGFSITIFVSHQHGIS